MGGDAALCSSPAMSSVNDREDAHSRLQRELFEERASALRRIAGKLERRLEALVELEAEIAGLDGDARTEAVARYRELYQQAETYRWYLIVQRECLGLTDHSEVGKAYPVPRWI